MTMGTLGRGQSSCHHQVSARSSASLVRGGNYSYLLDLICSACAAEPVLDIALEHLDLGARQVAGRLTLQVAEAGGALGVDKAYKSLERHGRMVLGGCLGNG